MFILKRWKFVGARSGKYGGYLSNSHACACTQDVESDTDTMHKFWRNVVFRIIENIIPNEHSMPWAGVLNLLSVSEFYYLLCLTSNNMYYWISLCSVSVLSQSERKFILQNYLARKSWANDAPSPTYRASRFIRLPTPPTLLIGGVGGASHPFLLSPTICLLTHYFSQRFRYTWRCFSQNFAAGHLLFYMHVVLALFGSILERWLIIFGFVITQGQSDNIVIGKYILGCCLLQIPLMVIKVLTVSGTYTFLTLPEVKFIIFRKLQFFHL